MEILNKNKRGSLLDPLYIIVFLFAFGIITIICLFILNEFEDGVSDKLTRGTSTYAIDQGQATILNFDNLFVFILIGLTIATMVGAFMIEQNPIVFWISFILLLVFLLVTSILANVYGEVTEATTLASTTENFSLITLVMSHLGLVLTIIFALVAIAMWAKWRAS